MASESRLFFIGDITQKGLDSGNQMGMRLKNFPDARKKKRKKNLVKLNNDPPSDEHRTPYSTLFKGLVFMFPDQVSGKYTAEIQTPYSGLLM